MKRKTILKLTLTALTAAAICLTISCIKDNAVITETDLPDDLSAIAMEQPGSTATLKGDVDCNFITITSTALTEVEVEMLMFVREEEKMARDVYLYLSEKYNKPIFRNIARSEQVHMDMVLCLLLHFDLDDPAPEEEGQFSNTLIKGMYDGLIDLGSENITGAMTAGANIEDFDIEDITEWILQAENEAIIKVFTSLACGSGNHLISFAAHLAELGVNYSPIYISPGEYEAILAAGQQFCGF